jgi:hypothetical protein
LTKKIFTGNKKIRQEGRPIFYLDETWLNAGHTKKKKKSGMMKPSRTAESHLTKVNKFKVPFW